MCRYGKIQIIRRKILTTKITTVIFCCCINVELPLPSASVSALQCPSSGHQYETFTKAGSTTRSDATQRTGSRNIIRRISFPIPQSKIR